MTKILERAFAEAAALSEEAQEQIGRELLAYLDRLRSLRETIDASIAGGGSHTDEEVAASITERLDAWERKRSSGSASLHDGCQKRFRFHRRIYRREQRQPCGCRAFHGRASAEVSRPCSRVDHNGSSASQFAAKLAKLSLPKLSIPFSLPDDFLEIINVLEGHRDVEAIFRPRHDDS